MTIEGNFPKARSDEIWPLAPVFNWQHLKGYCKGQPSYKALIMFTMFCFNSGHFFLFLRTGFKPTAAPKRMYPSWAKAKKTMKNIIPKPATSLAH